MASKNPFKHRRGPREARRACEMPARLLPNVAYTRLWGETMSEGPVEAQESSQEGSSTGLDPNLAGLLCYLLGLITGIVFIIIEKENRYVRFHAFQSLAVFGALFVLSLVAGIIPVVGTLISILLAPVGLILWILLMVKAYQGERFKIPLAGDWAEDQSG